MRRPRFAVLGGLVGITLAGAPVHAQPGRMMGMGRGMGMTHDSALATQMGVIHELVMGHDRITRTVTNLADGVRTVTESDDPRLAQLIRAHVAAMDQRVRAGSGPGLPNESPALRTIFRNKDKIQTTSDTTAKGVLVVQTSSDPATVGALQQHAADVSDLVQRGMAAMHDGMLKGLGAPPPPRRQ